MIVVRSRGIDKVKSLTFQSAASRQVTVVTDVPQRRRGIVNRLSTHYRFFVRLIKTQVNDISLVPFR